MHGANGFATLSASQRQTPHPPDTENLSPVGGKLYWHSRRAKFLILEDSPARWRGV